MEPYDSSKEKKIPRTLKCTHAFCTECILKLIKASPDKSRIKCPLKCVETTDCSKGLPKQSFILLDVINKSEYRTKLNNYYIRILKEEQERNGGGSNPGRKFQMQKSRTGTKIFITKLNGNK